MPGPLYRQINEYAYVRFDPANDSYSVVPADRVPPLTVAGLRVRLSMTERSDPSALFRRVALLAMLELMLEAHGNADSTATVAEMAALANAGGNPATQRTIGIPSLAPRPVPAATEAQQTRQPVSVEDVLVRGATPTPETLIELISALCRMTPAEIRAARAKLDTAWGAANWRRGEVVAKLVEWAKRPGPTAPPPARLSVTASAPGTYKRL